MLQEIALPNFGGSGGEVTVSKWLVVPGTEVQAGQVIAEIETEKAVAELEAPQSGVIDSILIAEGTDGVEVGTVLARLRIPGDEARDIPTATSAIASDSSASPVQADRFLASPYARKRALEENISLQGISGSGPGGRIVSRDLRSPEATSSSPLLDRLGYERESYTLTPANKMRRAIADNLSRSIAEIPHFSLTVNVELDAALAVRKAKNAGPANSALKISINDLIVWACARALMAVPAANTSWVDNGIAAHRNSNVAIAIALEDGLVAPVIEAAQTRTLEEIASASRDLIQRAKSRQLTTRDLLGATFTVSNLGMLGVASFTSILSTPQACILSVGAVEPRPVVRNRKIGISTQATLTLTCDHRVVDGAIGASFLNTLCELLESPPA